MKKFSRYLVVLAVMLALLTPALSLAEEPGNGLIPCGNPGQSNCDWNGLMAMINGLITFILVKLAIPVAAIMFAYAGFKMMFSGGNSEGMTAAKGIFFNTVIGLLWAAGAWLVISTLLVIMGFDGSWLGLLVNIN